MNTMKGIGAVTMKVTREGKWATTTKRIILAALAFFLVATCVATCAHAQTQTKTYLLNLTAAQVPDNNTNAVAPVNVRNVLNAVIPSVCTIVDANNCPLSALTGFGSNVQALLAGPSTGTGGPVGSNSPSLVTPNLGTPLFLTLTNATGLPNTGLLNPQIILGATSVALGATATTITGLNSVTSTTFIGALTGHASLDLPISALGTGVQTLLGGASAGTGGPVGSVAPTLTGTTQVAQLKDTGLASSVTQCVQANASGTLIGASSSCAFPAQISGLLPSAMAGANTTATMTISAGVASDSTGALYIPLSSPASWAVANGNAANGYQGGTTLPNSSTIHMFVCQGGSGVTTFASLSLTPTCPTGFASFFRRIFSFVTTGAGAPIPFIANEVDGGGMLAYLATQTLDINAATASTVSRTLYTLNVPGGIKVRWAGRAESDGAGALCLVTSPDETDVAPSASVAPLFAWTFGASFQAAWESGPTVTNTSGQIGIRCSAAGTLHLATRGWVDGRRS